MSRDAWWLLGFALVAPFFGLAWLTYVAKLAGLLAGGMSRGTLLGFQIVGVLVGLVMSGACIYAAGESNREEGP